MQAFYSLPTFPFIPIHFYLPKTHFVIQVAKNALYVS